jgi:hypothetical protein
MPGKAPEIQDSNSLSLSANGRIISYNLSEDKRPDGIKVRFKVRIAAGKRAREIDARQAEAIMEVLQWLSRNPGP